jgi:Spy/CpxP family protein refolding chaperone
MVMDQTVSTEQLAQLYRARNEANKRMSQALRTKDKTLVKLATDEASNFNRAYAYALRGYKRQQKVSNKMKKAILAEQS